MIDKHLHDYLIKVFKTFINVARSEDGEYFNQIPDDKFHIVYASPELFNSRKSKRILLNDKYLTKPLFTPYEKVLFVPHSFPLSQNNPHPEAPNLYLDAFLVDNSLPENQRIYMLLGSNSNNTVVIKSYSRLSDGRVIAVGNTIQIADLEGSEKDMMKLANVFISSVCFVLSKCKLNKVKSPINLEVAEL